MFLLLVATAAAMAKAFSFIQALIGYEIRSKARNNNKHTETTSMARQSSKTNPIYEKCEYFLATQPAKQAGKQQIQLSCEVSWVKFMREKRAQSRGMKFLPTLYVVKREQYRFQSHQNWFMSISDFPSIGFSVF